MDEIDTMNEAIREEMSSTKNLVKHSKHWATKKDWRDFGIVKIVKIRKPYHAVRMEFMMKSDTLIGTNHYLIKQLWKAIQQYQSEVRD